MGDSPAWLETGNAGRLQSHVMLRSPLACKLLPEGFQLQATDYGYYLLRVGGWTVAE